MEMENLKKAIEIILKQGEDYIKYLLWVLCYNPIKVLDELGLMDKITGKELQEEILTACKMQDENFSFASKETMFDTFGVDLRIHDPIIRDTVIEHCLEIADDQNYLRVCISNICTRRTSFDYYENRREGFNLLNFSQEEQAFLEKEIDTYRIGELLKAIQREKYPKFVPEYRERTIQSNVLSEDVGEYPNSAKLDSASLIENKDIVQQFLWCFNGTSFVNPKLLIENLDKVSILIEKAKLIKEKGIDPTKVGEKADAVGRLYASLECL